MGYDAAINKAWENLPGVPAGKLVHEVGFFSDTYSVDPERRRILSLSLNAPAKDFVSILLLHYLRKKIEGLPEPSGRWISFRELAGGESYYPAFRKRAVEPLIAKHGGNPAGIYAALEKVRGGRLDSADAAVWLQAFEKVPVMVEIWRGDDEFGPEASILFDSNIPRIFCTEDIAVLGGFIGKYA